MNINWLRPTYATEAMFHADCRTSSASLMLQCDVSVAFAKLHRGNACAATLFGILADPIKGGK